MIIFKMRVTDSRQQAEASASAITGESKGR